MGMNVGGPSMYPDERPDEEVVQPEAAGRRDETPETEDQGVLMLSDSTRSDILSRLRRIEGQARGIRRMIEEGRTCEEIVIQVAALKAAAAQVGIAIAGSHLVDCLSRDTSVGAGDRAALARFVKIFSKLS